MKILFYSSNSNYFDFKYCVVDFETSIKKTEQEGTL